MMSVLSRSDCADAVVAIATAKTETVRRIKPFDGIDISSLEKVGELLDCSFFLHHANGLP
jgi:hypothetical protein